MKKSLFLKSISPFLALIFFVGLIGFSTYNLGKKKISPNQEIMEDSNPQDFGIHFKKVNILLPEFSLPDLFDEEKDFSKKDLTGKFSIVNFFASWCTTCKAEHEILLALKNKKIADIYGVAWHDIDENTKSFLEKSGNPYTKVAKDNRGLFSKIIGLEAVPETLIVDKEGRAVMRFRGNLQEFSIDEIEQFIKKNQ